MKSPTDNPPKNALGAGISEVDLREAVARLGYPRQSVVARVLRQRFFVQEAMGSRASRGRGVASRLAAFLTGPMRRGA